MFYETGREVENIDSKENFIQLIRQYQNLVFSICLKMTGDYFAAEDLTQETFVSAYQHFEEFERRRGVGGSGCGEAAVVGTKESERILGSTKSAEPVSDTETPEGLPAKNPEKSWLCRIAANKCIDYKREATRRVQPVSEEEIPTQESANQTQAAQNEPLQAVLNHEILAELERCCSALSPPYKEAAVEYFINGKTAKEISRQSGIGLKTTQTHIYRAREMLKKIYRKEMLEK